jgi:hypothetical protein
MALLVVYNPEKVTADEIARWRCGNYDSLVIVAQQGLYVDWSFLAMERYPSLRTVMYNRDVMTREDYDFLLHLTDRSAATIALHCRSDQCMHYEFMSRCRAAIVTFRIERPTVTFWCYAQHGATLITYGANDGYMAQKDRAAKGLAVFLSATGQRCGGVTLLSEMAPFVTHCSLEGVSDRWEPAVLEQLPRMTNVKSVHLEQMHCRKGTVARVHVGALLAIAKEVRIVSSLDCDWVLGALEGSSVRSLDLFLNDGAGMESFIRNTPSLVDLTMLTRIPRLPYRTMWVVPKLRCARHFPKLDAVLVLLMARDQCPKRFTRSPLRLLLNMRDFALLVAGALNIK